MKRNCIIRQHDLKDCGICSLLSIIRYYNGSVPLEKLRQDTHTSLEGTSAFHLVKTAKEYGFDAYGIKIENEKELTSCILPAIAHVTIGNLNHFVVIYKITKEKIIVMDPAKGKVAYQKQKFLEIWTKFIIVIYPRYSIPKITETKHFQQYLKQISKNEKIYFALIVFITFLFTILMIATGFYFKFGLEVVNSGDKHLILSILLFFGTLSFLKIILNYLRMYYKACLNKYLDGYIYRDFLNHLFLLPNYFIKSRTSGEIMTRIEELEMVKSVMSEIVITGCVDSILSISLGGMLYVINKKLFGFTLMILMIYGIYSIINSKILYRKALRANEEKVNFNSSVLENIDSILTLKNLNVLSKSITKVETILFKYLESLHNLNKKIMKTTSFSYFAEEALHFGLLSFGIIEIANQRLTIIDLITFESLLNYFIEPVKNLWSMLPNYNFVKVSLNKINDFYNIPIENDSQGLTEFIPGNIKIEQADYSYNAYQKVFTNLSLEIPENEFVLLKGPSGCGKSTLCQMISRLIEVKNNNIKIGKVSVNDYNLQTIRSNITYVGQKENLIQDTIRNNILFDRKIEEKEFQKSIEICEIENIVSKKAMRYETFLLKDNMNLSGGEKQRIVLARALLNPSKILILDEALSEVNQDLEMKILKNIKQSFPDKTILYVSHKEYNGFFDRIYDFEELV